MIGAVRGEGSGPELVEATCRVLEAVERASPCELQIKWTNEIDDCSPNLINFCREFFPMAVRFWPVPSAVVLFTKCGAVLICTTN